jgi:hypothetical protein
MKFLLLSILLISPQLINSRVIIDLENEGREGSDFIKNLEWVTDKESESSHKSGQNTLSEINNQVYFKVPIDSKQVVGGLSIDVPTMKLTTIDEKGKQDIDYSLFQSPSDECLILNYPKANPDSSVSCTYSNGYSVITKSFPNKHYKKELSTGMYVIGLTHHGKFDIGLIQNNQVNFDNSFQSLIYKEVFKQFEKLTIKDFFIIPNFIVESSGHFWIVTEDELIRMEYSTAIIKIEFEKKETFSVKKHNLNLAELKQVLTFLETEHYLILSVGFYKLTKGTDRWEITFVEKLNVEDTEIELKNYEAALFRSDLCVVINGYGLVIFDNKMLNFKVFEHKQVLGLSPAKHNFGPNFLLGVLIDNQSDENIKEFFIELSISSSFASSEFKLNRVFISSQKVKTVKTDPQGVVTMLIMDTNTYIVLRSLYSGFSSLPVYVYKNAENSLSIEYINITDNVIIFSLADDKGEKVVKTLYIKRGDGESFSCSFKNEGSFFAQITRHFLSTAGCKLPIFWVLFLKTHTHPFIFPELHPPTHEFLAPIYF